MDTAQFSELIACLGRIESLLERLVEEIAHPPEQPTIDEMIAKAKAAQDEIIAKAKATQDELGRRAEARREGQRELDGMPGGLLS